MANCFYPCIKCHLPHNFHLRYTFDYFAQKMGVKKIGKIPNTHATVFRKISEYENFELKSYHNLFSKTLFYTLEIIKPPIKALYKIIWRK